MLDNKNIEKTVKHIDNQDWQADITEYKIIFNPLLIEGSDKREQGRSVGEDG